MICIGDQHFQNNNIPEVELFIERIEKLCSEKKPDRIILLGDLLHYHEKIFTQPLNKAYEFIDKMRKISKVIVLVGNHDYCFGKDTGIKLWNNETKMVQDIKNGDILVGDDGLQRNVVSTCNGKSMMYKIEQLEGDDYYVNENHILSLKCGFHKSIFWNKTKNAWTVKWIDIINWKLKSKFFSLRYKMNNKIFFRTVDESKNEGLKFLSTIEDIEVIDISVKEYLKIPKNIQNRLYGFKLNKSIAWEYKKVDIDPYTLGMWLGDGDKSGKGFCSADVELIIEWCKWALQNNAEITHAGQYNYGIRNNNYKSNSRYNILSIDSSTTTCKACINHIKKYKRAPSVACASIEEIEKLINKNVETVEYFTLNASKEQVQFINNISNLIEFKNFKIKNFHNIIDKSKHYNSPFLNLLKKYNLCNNKHIPKDYLVNSSEVRLQLLAGFIDTDGTVADERSICICQGGTNIHLIDELFELVKSLGFKCSISEIKNTGYDEVKDKQMKNLYISGDIEIIPTKLSRKKCSRIMNNGIDSRGRKCADKSRTNIKVTPTRIDNYYGFSTDGNRRFLLKDNTVVHNCNNQQFMTENHWLNGLKDWKDVKVVDKVYCEIINDMKFIFMPFVPNGRFEEGLNTLEEDWKNAKCIFAHQEFYGCKMGAIESVEGDKWPEEYPYVISGHIHGNQTPQSNVYYPGAGFQHSFGESNKNVIAYVTFEENESKYTLEEIDLKMPRKKIIYKDVEDLETYKVKKTEDQVKISVSGSVEEFKSFKKSKKYRELLESGAKVVFKPKRIELEEKKHEDESSDDMHFNKVLLDLVLKEKNKGLVEVYEEIMKNK